MLVSLDRVNSSSYYISFYSTLFSPFRVVFIYTGPTQPTLFVSCLLNNQHLVFFILLVFIFFFKWILTSLITNKGGTFIGSKTNPFEGGNLMEDHQSHHTQD